ncbi:MAG: PUA domain-containing protein [Nitrososphaerota archaeon]
MSIYYRKLTGMSKRDFIKSYINQLSKIIEEKLLIESKINIYIINYEKINFYYFQEKALLFLHNSKFFPALSLKFNSEIFSRLPSVFIDKGAIPHICNGADIMRPGIVKFNGNFSIGDIVLIKDIEYSKILAIGEALKESYLCIEEKKGRIIKNIHYIGDNIWKILPEIEGFINRFD